MLYHHPVLHRRPRNSILGLLEESHSQRFAHVIGESFHEISLAGIVRGRVGIQVLFKNVSKLNVAYGSFVE